MEEKIQKLVADFLIEYQKEHGDMHIWRTPLVGYADPYHPYLRNLNNIVYEGHRMPEEFLPDVTAVLCVFVPFTREVEESNHFSKSNAPSKVWAEAYDASFKMFDALGEYLVDEIGKLGYKAVIPTGVGMLSELLRSNWSQRHIAYTAGLGTFGINNMLITKEGCCGRYFNMVTNLPMKTGKPLEKEMCLYKQNGSCKVCVEHCTAGALTTEGFDRFKCNKVLEGNLKVAGEEVCGKCVTEIPCAFRGFA